MSGVSFRMPVYSGRVDLYLTRDAYIVARKKLDGHDSTRETKTNKGSFIRLIDEKKDESVYLLGWFDRNPGTLIHELVHVTFEALTYSGVPISKKNDEAFAYLLDSLFTASVNATKRARSRWKRAHT